MICVKEITQKVSNHPGRPSYDALHIPFLVSAGQVTLTLKEETYILIKDGGVRYVALITEDETFAPADKLDVGSSLEPGKDYYVYATTAGTIVVSRNSTYPAGYSAANSRKVGGFHTLCCATGTITGRPTNNLATGAIIPNSVWCLNFKPKNGRPEGMAYLDLTHTYLGASFPNLPKLPLWVDIYMQSGSGATTASAYGGTITDARVWDDHSDDMAAVMKRLPGDAEFSVGATGSNALTNIYGSQDPVTAGNCASGLFAGAGLNDLTVSRAAYVPPAGSANEAQEYEVEIAAAGTPDTFKWRQRNPAGPWGSYTTGVAITGSAQALDNGITVTFAATTGHTATDKWNIYVMNGLVDTDNRRMISDYFLEGCCGAMWQRNVSMILRHPGLIISVSL